MAKILVIDDDQDLRTVMRVALESAGHRVDLAPDGARGLEMQRTSPADVVITDIFMPDMEGMETILELQQHFPGTKIIAMSGGGDFRKALDYLSTARHLGAVKSVSKPFDHKMLLDAVQEVLQQPPSS